MTRFAFESSRQTLCREQVKGCHCNCLVRAESGLDELLAPGVRASGA